MWPAQLDTERHDLPTEVVLIYLLAFLHPFELQGWQELGQAMGARSVAWIRSYNSWSSDLAAQRLLRFNHHHIPCPSLLGTNFSLKFFNNLLWLLMNMSIYTGELGTLYKEHY